MDEQMRERFESWCRSEHQSKEFLLPDTDVFTAFPLAWAAWQACAAALSQPAAQGDSSHPAGGECGGVHLREALGFYADPERYHGPNQRVVRDYDPFTPEYAVYVQDVTRDRGQIARDALAKASA